VVARAVAWRRAWRGDGVFVTCRWLLFGSGANWKSSPQPAPRPRFPHASPQRD